MRDAGLSRDAQSRCGQMLNFCGMLDPTECSTTHTNSCLCTLQKIRILHFCFTTIFLKNDVCVCEMVCVYIKMASLLLYLIFSFYVMKLKLGAREMARLLRELDVQAEEFEFESQLPHKKRGVATSAHNSFPESEEPGRDRTDSWA